MTRPLNHPLPPAGHVLVPAVAIGALSVALAAGLEGIGILHRVNSGIAMIVSRNGAEKFPMRLPTWSLWLAAALFAFGLTAAMLGTPGLLRRVVLWVTAVVIVAGWAPVLSLASHSPDIAGPWIAVIWAGFCSIVYTANHRMPCDPSTPRTDETR